MKCKENFDMWLKYSEGLDDIHAKLSKIADNEAEIQKRFSTDLKFGTAGLRGIMGVGTDRMNIFTVRRATQGFCNYLKEKYDGTKVAISFDSRRNSAEFAKECAKVFCANDIKSYITKELAPTPFLSFAVRALGCQAGVMITASHNPCEYNGYKCYDERGAQMGVTQTQEIYSQISKVDIFKDVKTTDWNGKGENELIKFVKHEIYEAYINSILAQRINPDAATKKQISVTYTPLNGAGNKFVTKALSKIGVNSVCVVKEQADPDGNFPTCKYPNPEMPETFTVALKYAKDNSSDLIIATDPDSDRIGVEVLDQDEYRMLSGNELGVLLFNYILSQKKAKNELPQNALAIRTMVSTKMVDVIAENYGCKIISVPTGFKYIGSEIKKLEEAGKEDSFVFGFEESGGYLSGTYVRDKDAVCAAMLVCEMVTFYKNQGLSLIDVLKNLGEKYGFYRQKTLNFSFSGENGPKIMDSIMAHFRTYSNPAKLNGVIIDKKIISIADYLNSTLYTSATNSFINFPCPYRELNILNFELQDGISVLIRPSGTEPKLKFYVTACAEKEESAELNLEKIISYVEGEIQKYSD